ncbi:hypothetical protein [Paenibacillus alba]|uniref:Uncharacterized protein n=1 Tax=Paenibacillus alba TaxID=1197127 RepID=A0ABU6G4D9_9BACL|nr:hypothetical protein [Paenibacillus alba]MEC0229041.1 hypothetical protein [Paenibacillus alba]
MIVEINKFDIQRKIQDFNLYTTKRHETYAKVYGLFLKSEGTAKSLTGFRSVPDFEKFNFEELKYYFEKNEIPLASVKFILDKWDDNRSSSAEEMKAFYDQWFVGKAIRSYSDAKNEYLLSRLYLSDEVTQICDKLSFIIGTYCANLELFYDKNFPTQEKSAIAKELRRAEEEITSLIESLKIAMQKEMAIGYYT